MEAAVTVAASTLALPAQQQGDVQVCPPRPGSRQHFQQPWARFATWEGRVPGRKEEPHSPQELLPQSPQRVCMKAEVCTHPVLCAAWHTRQLRVSRARYLNGWSGH